MEENFSDYESHSNNFEKCKPTGAYLVQITQLVLLISTLDQTRILTKVKLILWQFDTVKMIPASKYTVMNAALATKYKQPLQWAVHTTLTVCAKILQKPIQIAIFKLKIQLKIQLHL